MKVTSPERSPFLTPRATWLPILQYLLALPSSQAAAAEKCEAKAISDLLDIRESRMANPEPSSSSSDATTAPQGGSIEDNAKALAMASLHLEQLQREMHGLRDLAQQVGNESQYLFTLVLTQYISAYFIFVY